jgi:tRNA pseudouridine55 synthase
VSGLTRLASGSFRLEDAVTLDTFAVAVKAGRWPELLTPVDEVLAPRFPALHLDADTASQLCAGQAIKVPGEGAEHADLARAYGPEGRFLALVAYDPARDQWYPRKVFAPLYSGSCSKASD